MNTPKTCACGCREITNATPRGAQRDFIRGHNRRLVGSHGWLETGYRHIFVSGRRIAEQRHVMELKLGGKLASDEDVHHVEGNKANNDPANLVLLTPSENQRLHACWSRKPWTPEQSTRALGLREAG